MAMDLMMVWLMMNSKSSMENVIVLKKEKEKKN